MAEDEINLVNYIKVIIHQKWLILITVFLVLILGIISSVRGEKQYKDTIVLETGQMNIYKMGTPSTFTPSTASQIQGKINNDLYKDDLKELDVSKITNVEVVTSEEGDSKKESRIVVMSATSTSPKALKFYLEKLGQVIIDQDEEEFKKQEDYLERVISIEEDKLEALEKNASLSSLQYLYVEHLSRIDDAEMSLNSIDQTKILKSPSEEVAAQKNNILMKSLMFLVIGLLLGVAFAFLKEFFQKNKDLLRE